MTPAEETAEARFFPPYAHEPGRNERHPDGLFADLRASARPGMAAEALAECAAWRIGLAFYRAGFHWEAHEVLEPVWTAAPPNSRERAAALGDWGA